MSYIRGCNHYIRYAQYTDMYDAAYRAAKLIPDLVTGTVKPCGHFEHLPFIPQAHSTLEGNPHAPIRQKVQEFTQRDGLYEFSYFYGFPFADISFNTPTVNCWATSPELAHHSRDYQVMTNSPIYEQQIALNQYWEQIGGTTMLPGTNRAADRFVRASFYMKAIPHAAIPKSSKMALPICDRHPSCSGGADQSGDRPARPGSIAVAGLPYPGQTPPLGVERHRRLKVAFDANDIHIGTPRHILLDQTTESANPLELRS